MAQFTATNTGARFTDTDDDVSFTAVGQRATFQAGYQAVSGSGGGGSFDGVHNDLDGRSTANAHPASAISGLGGAALLSVGTTAGTVAAGDDSRLTNSRTPTGGAGGFLSGSYPDPGVNTEALQDAVGAMAGTGLSYDDTAGTLNAIGGGTSVVLMYETNQNIATNFLSPGIPEGSFIILDGQTTSSQNGLYTATSAGGVTGRVDIYSFTHYGRVFDVQGVIGNKSSFALNADYTALASPDANTTHTSYIVGTDDGSTFTLRPMSLSYQAILELTGRAFPPAFADVTITADYQATLNDVLISVNSTAGNVTVTLGPHATIVRPLWIHHRAGSNTLTVVNYPGDGNAFSITIPPDEHRLILPDGADWIEWLMPQKASDLPYTPTTSGDWPGTDPAEVGEALDEIAERLTDSVKGFVNHGSTASTPRPSGYVSVEWYGTVEPTNAVEGDTWNSPS